MRKPEEKPTMFHWPSCRAALAALGTAAVAVAWPGLAWAQNAIQAITSSQQAGTEVVRIELSQPLAAPPAGFSVQSPPRIAIDVPGVSNALGRNKSEDLLGQQLLDKRSLQHQML